MLQKGTSQVSLLPVSDCWNLENGQFKGINITTEQRRAWQEYEFEVPGHTITSTHLKFGFRYLRLWENSNRHAFGCLRELEKIHPRRTKNQTRAFLPSGGSANHYPAAAKVLFLKSGYTGIHNLDSIFASLPFSVLKLFFVSLMVFEVPRYIAWFFPPSSGWQCDVISIKLKFENKHTNSFLYFQDGGRGGGSFPGTTSQTAKDLNERRGRYRMKRKPQQPERERNATAH